VGEPGSPTPSHPMHQRGTLLAPSLRWLLLALYLLYTLLPIVWLFVSTVQTQASLLTLPPSLLPRELSLQNYVDIFAPAAFGEASGQSTFFLALRNSVIVSVGTTALALVLGTLAAYAFARFNLPHQRTLLLLVLGTQLLPAVSLIIPLFRMLRAVNLLDTLAALILAYSTFSLPFVVWIMAGYFQSVPLELEEAARIDGASRFGAFWRIALPLAAPGLAATAIFTLLNAWDEFFFALIFSSTYSSKTVPVALAEFIGRHNVNWGLLVTGGFIASLPPIVLSLVCYRYIVSGLAAGGLKG
jgi:multiple sugar transport system permease protein